MEKMKEKDDKMKYIAHKDGEREQTIKEHLIGTATLATICREVWK